MTSSTFFINGFICPDTIGNGYFFVRTTDGEHFLLHMNSDVYAKYKDFLNNLSKKDFAMFGGEIHIYREHLTLYVNEIKILWKAETH